jgi:hypothetical protein
MVPSQIKLDHLDQKLRPLPPIRSDPNRSPQPVYAKSNFLAAGSINDINNSGNLELRDRELITPNLSFFHLLS